MAKFKVATCDFDFLSPARTSHVLADSRTVVVSGEVRTVFVQAEVRIVQAIGAEESDDGVSQMAALRRDVSPGKQLRG